MLSEEDVERIRQGVREGIRGPIVLSWVQKLLLDREERVLRDRRFAAELLSAGRDQETPPVRNPAEAAGEKGPPGPS
jgi:hypothetical protein